MEPRLFNARELGSLTNLNSRVFFENFKRPQGKLRPVNTDPQLMNFFQVKVDLYRYAITRSRDLLIRLKEFGGVATEELQKEYHFE